MLPDIQNTQSSVKIKLHRVGIKNLKLPIYILTKGGIHQHTVADINCYVDLHEEIKGISMSRLPIGLNKFIGHPLSSKIISDIAENIRIKSEADTCEIVYKFPYFIQRLSPINKEPGLVWYDVVFNGIKTENNFLFRFNIQVTATSLCPCSKEISEYNAHNQRSLIKIYCTPKTNSWVWIEDIAEIAEESASCKIYSILKRPDEKYVTEQMFNNPAFVEDITRTCYFKLKERNDLETFMVEVTNQESIHQHDAYSFIEVRQ